MEFSASKVLGDAIALMTSRIGTLLSVVAIYIVVAIVMFLVFGASMMSVFQQAILGGAGDSLSTPPGGGFFAGVFLFYILFYALQFFEQAALSRLCSDRHEPNVGDALGIGLRSVLPLFGVAILAFVSMFVVMFVLGLLTAALGVGGNPAVGSILPLAMLIGGVWLMSRLCVILPVIANDEERNPIRAIAAAWAMTAGNALKIALLFVAVGVVMAIIFGGLFFGLIGTPEPGNIPNFGSLGLMMILFLLVLGTLAGIYIVAMVTAIHNQLAPTGTDRISEAFA